jgi:TRAP-type C4-dicarboxylate transport system permease small subunit
VEAAVGLFGIGCVVAGVPMLELTIDQPSAILELPMAYVYAACPVFGGLVAGDVLATWASGRREDYNPVDIT